MKSFPGPFLARRAFLRSLSAALPAFTLLPRAIRAATTDAKLPPIRALTRGPKFHWRGYYDKLIFDPGQRFVLANEVDFEGRSPRPEDVLHVGMIDMRDGDRWIELGTSRAWNWQQGCMLQWVPGTESSVAWNDREGDRFICHVLDVKSGMKRTLPNPFYCLSPDGRWGLAPDFRRLNDTRPGYGYTGIPDPNRDEPAPADAGIWRLDMRTGEQTLIFSFADAVKIPQADGFPDGAKHWFNHLLFNTDGKRFVFLHRWRRAGQKMWLTRMFSLDPDGRNPFLLIPTGKVSHFVWRDSTHVTAYAGHPPANEWKFYVFKDKTDKVEVIGEGVLNRGGDGHNTYVPGTHHQWVLNDTYPDTRRCQNPHLFHIPSGRIEPLGHFHAPPEYQGEWRCDTHPCASPDGKKVLIDSPHGGNGRQVYLINISDITGR